MAKKKSMYEVGDIVETQTENGLVKGEVVKKLYAELNPPVWIYTIKGKLADGTPYMANSVREEDVVSSINKGFKPMKKSVAMKNVTKFKEQELDPIFKAHNEECKKMGLGTKDCNKLWEEKYKPMYEEKEAQFDKILKESWLAEGYKTTGTTEKHNMSIKDKKGAYEFKNSNLRFHGMKMDINGNPCFVLSTPNQRAFSVQQDPAYTIYWELGQSGESIVEKNYKDSNEFEEYIVDYIKKFGSKKQKSNLHVYNEDNRKIGFYADNKGNKAVYTMSYDESDNECELTKVKNGKKELVARTKIFSNGKITTSYKGGYDLENCDELHKDYFDFVEKHIKKDNNFACGKGNFGLSTYSWGDVSGFTEQEKEDLINGKLKCYYVSAIDKFMSGLGGAKGGNSKIIVICWSNKQMHKCVEALESKKDFKNITWGYGFPKNITNYAHCQIYNFDDCYDWNRGYFGNKSGKFVYIGDGYKSDLIDNDIIPHRTKWIIKTDKRNIQKIDTHFGEQLFLTESFKEKIKSQFSIIDDTKDVLRAGGKLAGNVVKDTLYNGGILMF